MEQVMPLQIQSHTNMAIAERSCAIEQLQEEMRF